MERQEISPDLSSREIVQRKIAGALDYLGENLNIVDKSVREGKATNMDIARSFTGDVKSDKLTENIGLLDLTGAGTYFAFEEGEKDILKAEPDNFKRQMALLSALRQPLQTIIDRPDIGLPAFDMMSGVAEAIPATAVMLRPVKKFLLSLRAKATKPSKDVGMNIQKTSLPISGGDSTTTKIAENQVTDPSRRKFVKGVGALGALTTVSPLIGDIPIDKIKLATKSITKIPTTFSNSLKKFTAPLYRNYLDEVIENNKMIGRSGKTEFEDLPITDENAFEENSITANIYEGLFNNQGGALGEFEDLPLEEKAKLVEKNYGVKDGLHIKPNELSDKLVFDASVDFGGDYENEFRSALQNRAIEDGAKPTEILETEPEYAGIMVYQDAKASDNMADVVEEYYEKLIKDGRSPDDIAEQVFEGPFPE